MKIPHISYIFSMTFTVFTENERSVIEQSRILLFLSGIFLFCPTNVLYATSLVCLGAEAKLR